MKKLGFTFLLFPFLFNAQFNDAINVLENPFEVFQHYGSTAIGDINNDGLVDLLMGSDGLIVYWGIADGIFSHEFESLTNESINFKQEYLIDIDNDNLLELVCIKETVGWYNFNFNGEVTDFHSTGLSAQSAIGIGDANNDGQYDLAFITTSNADWGYSEPSYGSTTGLMNNYWYDYNRVIWIESVAFSANLHELDLVLNRVDFDGYEATFDPPYPIAGTIGQSFSKVIIKDIEGSVEPEIIALSEFANSDYQGGIFELLSNYPPLNSVGHDYQNSHISWRKNLGNGNFEIPSTSNHQYLECPSPYGPYINDINNDGVVNFIVDGLITDSIWNNDFSVSFDSSLNLMGPYWMLDLDNDGDLDVLHNNTEGQNHLEFLSNENGTFNILNDKNIDYPTYFNNVELFPSDIDSNGLTDLFLILNSSERVALINMGDFEFEWIDVHRQAFYQKIASNAADIDGDGDIDLSFSSIDENIYWLENNGNAVFIDTLTIEPNVGEINNFDWIDLNSDGHLDLISILENNLFVSYNNGDNTFPVMDTVYESNTTSNDDPFQIEFNEISNDIDGDGDEDLFATKAIFENGTWSNDPDHPIIIWLEFENGEPIEEHLILNELQNNDYVRMVAEDLNQDGFIDLICKYGQAVYTLLNDGNGQFTIELQNMGSGNKLKVADLNGDGLPDVVTWNYYQGIYLYLNDGLDSFLPGELIVESQYTSDFILADINQDSVIDLFVTKGSDSGIVYWNEGNSNFSNSIETYIGNAEFEFLDLNSDLMPDLIDHSTHYSTYPENAYLIYLNNSPFAALSPLYTSYLPQGVYLNWNTFPQSIACQIKGGLEGGTDPHTFIVTGTEPSQKFINGNGLIAGEDYQWKVRCATGVNPYSGITAWSDYDYFTYNPLWDPNDDDNLILEEELELKIYPNPSQDESIISISNFENETFILELKDQQGRTVRTEMMNDAAHKLERQNLASGMYLLSIKTPNGQVLKTEKLLFE